MVVTPSEALRIAEEAAVKALDRYVTMHPRPSWVSQKQAAEMIGKSIPTVRKMIRSGVIGLNAQGQIPTCEIDRILGVKTPFDLPIRPEGEPND